MFDNEQIHHQEFLRASDSILGNAPARIVLMVGGPGSGKGLLSKRLQEECGIVHLSSGDLLRDEGRSKSQVAEATKILEKIGLNSEKKPTIRAANIILDMLK